MKKIHDVFIKYLYFSCVSLVYVKTIKKNIYKISDKK